MSDVSSDQHNGDQHETTNWLIALVVALLFALGNYGLSHTSAGRWLEFKAYDLLHAGLPDLDKDLPIVIVDIGEIPAPVDKPTSRKVLIEVLEQIVNVDGDKRPATVGIDIDCSPNGPISTKEDQYFFAYCDDIRQGNIPEIRKGGIKRNPVPILLGVGRRAYNAPSDWFGYPKFIPLAANIRVNPDDTHLTSRWTMEKSDKKVKIYGTERLLSMGQALAQAYADSRKEKLPAPTTIASMVETIPADPVIKGDLEVSGMENEEFESRYGFLEGVSLVNYSKLDQMKGDPTKVVMENHHPKLSGKFAGKIVLLGDTEALDVFTIPGPIKPLKGVYLHASAAYTFLREPLYNLRHIWRGAIDLLLSVVLTILLAIVDVKARAHPRRIQFKDFTRYGLFGLMLLGCMLLVRFTGIMWFDFIAIIVALMLEPPVEHYILRHVKRWTERNSKQPALFDNDL